MQGRGGIWTSHTNATHQPEAQAQPGAGPSLNGRKGKFCVQLSCSRADALWQQSGGK